MQMIIHIHRFRSHFNTISEGTDVSNETLERTSSVIFSSTGGQTIWFSSFYALEEKIERITHCGDNKQFKIK